MNVFGVVLSVIQCILLFSFFVSAGFSVVIGIISVITNDREAVTNRGFFQGYTSATYLVILLGVSLLLLYTICTLLPI